MTKVNEYYKCNMCGNIVQVNHKGAGELVCCGKPMKLLNPLAREGTGEKHIPVINEKDNGYEVVVSTVEHPMGDDHYIEWIELVVDGISHKKFLTPSDEPKAFFQVEKGSDVKAYEFCNLHGLWVS